MDQQCKGNKVAKQNAGRQAPDRVQARHKQAGQKQERTHVDGNILKIAMFSREKACECTERLLIEGEAASLLQ